MYASITVVKQRLIDKDFSPEEAEQIMRRYGDIFEDQLSEQATADAIIDAHLEDMEKHR